MYLKVTTLRMMLCGGVHVQSGRAIVCVCMRPPRRDECSGAPNWSVECDSLTGQGAFECAGTMEMSKRLACLRGRLLERERAVGCSLSGLQQVEACSPVHLIFFSTLDTVMAAVTSMFRLGELFCLVFVRCDYHGIEPEALQRAAEMSGN